MFYSNSVLREGFLTSSIFLCLTMFCDFSLSKLFDVTQFWCKPAQVWQGNIFTGSCATCKFNKKYLEYEETKHFINSFSGAKSLSNFLLLSLLTFFFYLLCVLFLLPPNIGLLFSPPPPFSSCTPLFPLVFHHFLVSPCLPPFISISLSPITPWICLSPSLPSTSHTVFADIPSIFWTNQEMIRDTDSPETQVPPACRGKASRRCDAMLNGRAEIRKRL